MPFKSEAQRRYLWANEPEIARDWADTYGSRIQKNKGGIMHQFENYAHDNGGNVSVPRSFQARPHSAQVNLAYITPEEQGILQALKPGTPHRGPMEIPNYDSYDVQGGYATSGQLDSPTAGDISAGVGSGGAGAGGQQTHIGPLSSNAQQAWDNMADQRKDYQDVENIMWDNRKTAFNLRPEFQKQTQMYNPRSKFNPLRMIGGLFGNPGKLVSGIMGLKDNFFQGRGEYDSQAAWEQAKQNRINQKRIDNMLSRKGKGLDYGEQNLYDLSGGQYDFREDQFGENQAGITGTDEGKDYKLTDYITKIDDAADDAADDNIDWENEYDFTDKRLPPSHPDHWKKQDIDYGWKEGESLPTTHPDYFTRKNRGYGYIEDYKDPNDPFHVQREDYPKTQWVDTHNRTDRGSLPIEYYYPLKGNKQGLETIDINEDVLDINEIGPTITKIGGDELSIPQEWLKAPISQIERTIQNLQTGVDNADALGMADSEENKKNKEKLEQLKKVIEIKKKKGETAEGIAT